MYPIGYCRAVGRLFVLVQFNANHRCTTGRFLVLCVHYSARALTFARARLEDVGQGEESEWTVPLIFVGALVAYRFCFKISSNKDCFIQYNFDNFGMFFLSKYVLPTCFIEHLGLTIGRAVGMALLCNLWQNTSGPLLACHSCDYYSL